MIYKNIIKTVDFTLEVSLVKNILTTKLLYFNEKKRGTGLLWTVEDGENYYTIKIMSNFYSAIYDKRGSLNIVINGDSFRKDQKEMDIKIQYGNLEQLKKLLFKHAILTKLKII